MKKFMDKDFLLETETARKLYHEHAEHMPIIDYHCHLPPKEIYEDKKFRNLAEAWLGAGDRYGDHYKWRSLRARGYEEDSISGPDDATKSTVSSWNRCPISLATRCTCGRISKCSAISA